MRSSRLLVSVLAVAGLLAVVVPGVGSSAPAAKAACGREEFVAGLEAVFGRFKTLSAATAFRNKVAARGFQNLNIIPGCNEYRVVLRGIESFDVGVDLQAEALRGKFRVTLECLPAKDDVGELEVVFGHRRTRVEAQQLISRTAALGFQGAQLEGDPCGGFEIIMKGFSGRAQADEFVAEAKSVGFDAVVEGS